MKSLGAKIKELRVNKGYSLDKLALLTDSSKSYIWALENKEPPRPSADKLLKIADKLGVTIEYLLDNSARVQLEDATDRQFYSNYLRMDRKSKAKVRRLFDLWSEFLIYYKD